MQIKIYPIQSILANKVMVTKQSEELIEKIKEKLNYEMEITNDISKLKNCDLPLILVQSGGSEEKFLTQIYPYFDGPYYLLTYGANNSLAASLEILSFVHDNNKKGEVLHGNLEYIISRIKYLIQLKTNKDTCQKLGVLGHPSSWLIASNVNYKLAKDIFNVELVDVSSEIVNKYIENADVNEVNNEFFSKYNKEEIIKAYKLYVGLKQLVSDYDFKGFTLRCFDLLYKFKTSSCLALAILNKENIVSTCEGDIPCLISGYVIKKLLNLNVFQANPQHIDIENNYLEFAHCTLPLDMADSYELETHFESNIGVGIHGELKLTDCTIFKIGANLKEFYVSEGIIIENQHRNDRCRSQIKIKLNDDVTYFLKSSLANHHQIVYGHHQREITDYMLSLGLKRVC